MVNLNQLKRENVRLRKMQTKLNEVKRNNEDRAKLLRENKRLARDIKFGKSIAVGRKAGKVLSEVGKASGKGLAIAGRGVFRGLQRYAKFLAEQEMKQRALNRRLKVSKRVSKKVSNRRTKGRKK